MSYYMDDALSGDAEAMNNLADFYHGGHGGVAQNFAQSLAWYTKAAAMGHSGAMYSLGHMHENGKGTAKDPVKALGYYKQANAQGNNCKHDIARVEAVIAKSPTLRAGAAAAVAAAAAVNPKDENARKAQARALGLQQEAAFLELERTRLETERAAFDDAKASHERTVAQERDAFKAEKKREYQASAQARIEMDAWKAEKKREERAFAQARQELEAEKARLQRESDALEEIKRQREAPPPVDASTVSLQAAAASKQADILEARRKDKGYAPKHDAIAATWLATAIDLFLCQPCARRIAPGQSVLLDGCLHSICRDCSPHMLQSDNTIVCSVCRVVSTVAPGVPPPYHPFIEAELASAETHDCIMCAPLSEEDRMHATVKCSDCQPSKLLCDGHALNHRAKLPAHVLTPLPHGAAAMRCPTHDKPIDAYCTTCQALICLACFASTHPVATHEVRLLTDAAFVDAVRGRLTDGVAAARKAAEALLVHATDATVAVTEVDERDAAIEGDVHRAFKVLVGLLERQHEAVQRICAEQSRKERAALQQVREESEYRWRITASAADLAEQLATGTHLGVNATAVMVQLEAVTTARLKALLELAPPERGVPAPAMLRFVFDESLGQQLANCGRILHDA